MRIHRSIRAGVGLLALATALGAAACGGYGGGGNPTGPYTGGRTGSDSTSGSDTGGGPKDPYTGSRVGGSTQ